MTIDDYVGMLVKRAKWSVKNEMYEKHKVDRVELMDMDGIADEKLSKRYLSDVAVLKYRVESKEEWPSAPGQ